MKINNVNLITRHALKELISMLQLIVDNDDHIIVLTDEEYALIYKTWGVVYTKTLTWRTK